MHNSKSSEKKIKIIIYNDEKYWTKVFVDGRFAGELEEGVQIFDYLQIKVSDYDFVEMSEVWSEDLEEYPLTNRYLRYTLELDDYEQRFIERRRFDLMDKYLKLNKILPIGGETHDI